MIFSFKILCPSVIDWLFNSVEEANICEWMIKGKVTLILTPMAKGTILSNYIDRLRVYAVKNPKSTD